MTTLDSLRRVPLFAQLSNEQLQWIAEHSNEVQLHPDELLSAQGSPAEYFHVVLAGEIQVSRRVGAVETVLVTHLAGAFTGEVPLLTGTPHVATTRALSESCLLRMKADDFRAMLVVCSPVLDVILSAMAQRVQTMEALLQQREKLVALGTLAAGLAHELNNPAAAAQRAAGQLRERFQSFQTLSLALHALHLAPAQLAYLADLQSRAAQQVTAPLPLDALEQSDREEALIDWLDEHEIVDGWKLAPTLVRAGLDSEQLEDCAAHLPAGALPDTLVWLEAALAIQGLSDEIEHSSGRISTLIKAVKEYSYMDQAPMQEIDIYQGLESTLTILNHKLKNVVVRREYDRNLPRISAYGSELNQVWTNLIDNAIDAMEGQGQLWIRTSREHDRILVEIADNGPGIPAEIQPRIFEPFFTTKGVGQGTGLGLDISYRIVGRHHGDISVTSRPGDTRFQVRLPVGSS